MITPEHLQSLVDGLDDDAVIDLTKAGNLGAVGQRVRVLPGVRGDILHHDEDGDTVVRCKVRGIRHALRLLAA